MAQYRGFTYDEYIKPLEQMQKVHNETLADMSNMSATSDILDYYIDPNDPDSKESYALYNNFKTEFNKQVDDFAKNGLTRSNGMNLLRLHRNYNNNIANVLDALKNKKTEEAAQMSAQEKSNGQMVFSKYANKKGLDSYLHGKIGYDEQNLDEVHKFAKNEAAAASKRRYSNNIANAVRVLNNNYYNVMEEEGYNTKDSYQVISNLLSDMENQLSGGVSPTEGGDDTPDGFIRNMRAELQKRGIENYSEEDRRKIIDAFLTGTYEGLTYEQKNKQLDTPEMRAKGATRVSYSGGNGSQYPNSPYKPQSDKFTIQGEYSFNEGKLDNAIKDFTLPTRVQFEPGYEPEMFESNGTDGSYHICDYDIYILKLKEKYGSNFWQNEERFKRHYYDTLKRIKEAGDYDEIPESFYKWGTNVAIELMNRKDELKNLTRPTEFDFPYLQFNPQDTKEIARGMLNRSSDTQIYSNIKYNAKNKKFVPKDTESAINIRKIIDNNDAGDIQMWLAPTPIGDSEKGSFFHIAMKVYDKDDGKYKLFFIPLTSGTHWSDAAETNALYEAYQINLNVINAIKQKYSTGNETEKDKIKITDKNDSIKFKEATLFMKEFYKQHLLNTIKGAHQDVTDYKVDINAGPDWVDINGNPIDAKIKNNSK